MKYMHVIMACASEPWAMEKTKLLAVMNFLRFKAAGRDVAAEEVARITQKTEREVQKTDGAVAILPIQGCIGERMNLLDDISGGTSTEMLSKQFRALLNDNAVKAIVLDINSPGGVARSVEELASEIYDARGIKPIVAQVNTMAASAAYWIAAQAGEVVVTPSGQAGSIGVYTMHEDISEYLANEGIKETLIYSGEFKTLGNPYEPLSEVGKSVMQQRVDQLADSFVRAVARGRNVTLTQVSERFGQGLMFNAPDLVDRGMADRIAPMSETLARFGVDLNPALSRAREAAAKPAVALNEPPGLTARLGEWGRRVNDADVPPPQEFESFLREVGISKTRSARIASRVHAALRSESGDSEATTRALDRLSSAVRRFAT